MLSPIGKLIKMSIKDLYKELGQTPKKEWIHRATIEGIISSKEEMFIPELFPQKKGNKDD